MKKMGKVKGKVMVLAIVSVLVLCWHSALSDAAEIISLQMGQQRILEVEDLTRVAIADPKIADVRLLSGGRELLIIGLSEGITGLTTWDGRDRRTVMTIVVGKGIEDLADEIRGLLANVAGVEVKVVGDKVVLDGRVLTRSDRERVNIIAAAYRQVLNLVTISAKAHNELLEELLEESIGMPGVEATVVEDRVVLRGTVFNEDDVEKAERIASAHFPEVINILRVEEAMVEINLHFARIDMSKGRDVGVHLLNNLALSAEMIGGRGISPKTTYALALDALSSLNYLVSRGAAEILAKPHLTTKSGQKAQFHSGGELGFRVEGGIGPGTVEWKEYGLLLEIKPVVRSDGRISNRISIEVSAPVAIAGTADMAFTKFTTESTIISRSNESIVISGLVQSIQSEFRERTPILGDIPILGFFFSRTRDVIADTELVVIVTPTIPTIVKAVDHVPGSAAYREILRRIEEDN